MEWLAVSAFGIMWAAILFPSPRRRPSPRTSVEDFGRDMDLLAHAEGRTHGRWIVTPQKGVPFLGMPRRERVRARERRRHVFVFLLESLLITFLIGLVPPLRVMWMATASLAGLLLAYVWLPDGRMLNRVMIDEGYAQPLTIPPNVEFADVFRAGARAARQAGLGLWQACGGGG